MQLHITKRAHYYLEKRWDDIIDWSVNVVRKLSMVIAKNVGALLQAQFVNNRLEIMVVHPFDHFLTDKMMLKIQAYRNLYLIMF